MPEWDLDRVFAKWVYNQSFLSGLNKCVWKTVKPCLRPDGRWIEVPRSYFGSKAFYSKAKLQ